MLTFCLAMLLQVRPKVYSVPKYPAKSEVRSLSDGVWPGRTAGENDKRSAEFKRVEYIPTSLRLLVRMNCTADVSSKDLIEKAQRSTSEHSDVVQIDWGRVTSNEVMFYGVFYTLTRTTHVTLSARDGKYMIDRHNITEDPRWEVRRITLSDGACVDEREMTERDLQVAVLNLLTMMTGDSLRSRDFN